MEPRTAAPTDEDLIRASAAGDRAAFDALVGRHAGTLYRFAVRTCRAEDDAADALQDALLAAWRGAATFRGEAAGRTWLFQILVHACRRRGRRRAGEPERHEPMEALADLAAGGGPVEAQVAARQASAALERALSSLPDDAREVLLLRDVEGLSGQETAAALGIELAAMKSRLHRARLELKARVEAILGHPVEEVVS